MIRVAINGYGRIGRLSHRIILEKYAQEIEIAAINVGNPPEIKVWENLLKYDTAYGMIRDHSVKSEIRNPKSETNSNNQNLKDLIGYLIIDDREIPVLSQKDLSLIPWKDLEIDVVIESTGKFRTEEELKKHLDSGAKAVILSAPPKSEGIPAYVLSVNAENYQGEKIINNASCTTNCIAPVAKIIEDNFGIEKAMMTTVHAYTSDQMLQDGGHKDLRRSRAAGFNIIPTSTGASEAAAKVIPSLKDKFKGLSLRVPVITGSLSDLTFVLKKETTAEEVNGIFKKEAQNAVYKGILEVTEDQIVSSDIIGNPASAIVDLSLTQIVGGNLLKVIAWYDNEFGYANRLVEEVLMIGKFEARNPKS